MIDTVYSKSIPHNILTLFFGESVDYWKLIVDEDGNPGWQEDGNLNFNVDELPSDAKAAVEELLRMQGSGLTEDGRIPADQMNSAIVQVISANMIDAPAGIPGVMTFSPETSQHVDALMRWRMPA
ncbi:MAG: hypothetical protein P1R74_11800 [Sedimenticola sp.]|nr:hypothetical protein [Sedimenticola sp.]